MPITALTKHDNHQVRVHHTRNTGPHYAALRCVDCNRHIQWLNSGETHLLARLGVEVSKGYNRHAEA